jgi:uncharacterized alpha-E superfamily protein
VYVVLWVLQPLVKASGKENDFRAVYGKEFTARNVTDYLLWYPCNPNAVISCIQHARENICSVRERISSDMWEHINRVFQLITAMMSASSIFYLAMIR